MAPPACKIAVALDIIHICNNNSHGERLKHNGQPNNLHPIHIRQYNTKLHLQIDNTTLPMNIPKNNRSHT